MTVSRHSSLARSAVQWWVVSQHDLGANSKQLGVVMVIMLSIVLIITVTWSDVGVTLVNFEDRAEGKSFVVEVFSKV